MENFDFEKVIQILTAISLSYQLIEKAIKRISKINKKEKRLERLNKHRQRQKK